MVVVPDVARAAHRTVSINGMACCLHWLAFIKRCIDDDTIHEADMEDAFATKDVSHLCGNAGT